MRLYLNDDMKRGKIGSVKITQVQCRCDIVNVKNATMQATEKCTISLNIFYADAAIKVRHISDKSTKFKEKLKQNIFVVWRSRSSYCDNK